MQPTFARRIFPCYDEPKYKTDFSIALIYNAKYRAISNSEVVSASYHST